MHATTGRDNMNIQEPLKTADYCVYTQSCVMCSVYTYPFFRNNNNYVAFASEFLVHSEETFHLYYIQGDEHVSMFKPSMIQRTIVWPSAISLVF